MSRTVDYENPKFEVDHNGSDVTAVAYCDTYKTIAVGCFNGTVYIRDAFKGRTMYEIMGSYNKSPIVCMKWHPYIPNVLLCGSADGTLVSVQVENSQRMWEIKMSSINSFDISPNGELIAVGGADPAVHIISLKTKNVVKSLQRKLYDQNIITGHVTRICSVKFDGNNKIHTCGWDNVIITWDISTGEIVRSIPGPHIRGDTLSFHDNLIVTGSCGTSNQIEFWNANDGKRTASLSISEPPNTMDVYALCLSPSGEFVAVGGTNINKLYVISTETFHPVSISHQFPASITAVVMSERTIYVGFADSGLIAFNY